MNTAKNNKGHEMLDRTFVINHDPNKQYTPCNKEPGAIAHKKALDKFEEMQAAKQLEDDWYG